MLILFFHVQNVYSSAEISINVSQKIISIDVDINFYGNLGTSGAKIAENEILKSWVLPKHQFPKNSNFPNYLLKINLITKILTDFQAKSLLAINNDFKQNFIRLELGDLKSESFILSNGNNGGVWYMGAGIGKTKTAAHEFGHILGLGHLTPNDQRGFGNTISIMSTKLTEVDLEAQNKNLNQTIFGFYQKCNISKRKVTDGDLVNLANVIKKYSQGKFHKISLGLIPNFYYDENAIPQ